jgi:hypothetical protein
VFVSTDKGPALFSIVIFSRIVLGILASLALDEALGVFQIAVNALDGVINTRLLRIISS